MKFYLFRALNALCESLNVKCLLIRDIFYYSFISGLFVPGLLFPGDTMLSHGRGKISLKFDTQNPFLTSLYDDDGATVLRSRNMINYNIITYTTFRRYLRSNVPVNVSNGIALQS